MQSRENLSSLYSYTFTELNSKYAFANAPGLLLT